MGRGGGGRRNAVQQTMLVPRCGLWCMYSGPEVQVQKEAMHLSAQAVRGGSLHRTHATIQVQRLIESH